MYCTSFASVPHAEQKDNGVLYYLGFPPPICMLLCGLTD